MRFARQPAPRGRPAKAGSRSHDEEAATRGRLGPSDGVPWRWSGLLAAAMLGCYLLLAPHVPGDKDASEFALALATGGVLHPTGYPLYTILGHVFVVLLHHAGVGFIFAANAWAACGGGVAMLLFHRLALRLLPSRGDLSRLERFLLAALPVVVLGFNPVWMVECTVVEVHSWQMAWVCGTALYFIGLVEALETCGARRMRLPPRMVGWGLLCGLGGAHHSTAVFFAGGMTIAVCWALASAKRFRAWVPLVWLAAGIVPLLSWGYIAYKAFLPGTSEVWPTLEPNLRSVLAHVTAHAYRKYVGHWAPDDVQAAWLRWYIYPYLWPGLALLALQWWRARGARRRVVTGLLLAAAAQVVFVYRYGVSDPDAYFLPCLAAALLALAPSGADVVTRLRRIRFGVTFAAAGAVVALALFVAPCVSVMAGRRRALIGLDEYYHGMWRSIPYERAIVLWPVDGASRLREYQVFRGEKPGFDVYNTTNLLNDAPRARFRRRYGFDPLAMTDRAHLSEPLKQDFVIGQQPSELDAHGYALIHECIAERAGIPVVAFDPPRPPRTLSPNAASPPPATPPR